MTMNSVSFGWECNGMNNNGANMGMEVKRALTITGIQVDCSIMSLSAEAGYTQVLFNAVMFPGAVIQGPPPQLYLGEGPNPDFSFGGVFDTNAIAHGNAGQGPGRLFIAIAKIWSPSATSRVIAMPCQLDIPAGAQIMFHMDHQGVMCDAEMQGVFYYV